MSRLIKILKPAPPIPEIKGHAKVAKEYRYWRWRIFYSMYFGYIFYYFTRKSFTFAMPALMVDLGLNEADLGMLGTLWALAYGISKFTSGILADRSNPRYFLSIGLILTGILNIFFGLSSSIVFFSLFWGLNGWFQGWGWPGCARLLTHWYSQKERGRWWGVWNTSHNVGGAIIPLIAAYCAMRWGWRSAMYVPGVACIGLGFILMNRLRDTPQSLGLPSIEKFKNDYPTKDHNDTEKELSVKQILVGYILKNKYIWLLAAAYFFVYIVRQAINDWSVLFLMRQKGYEALMASTCVSLFEVGGFFGSLAAGWGSDSIFKGKRGPVNALFMVGVFGSVVAFYFAPGQYVVLNHALVFLIGFFVFGPQMLIGVAAAELSHKKAAATATGFTGCFAYLGAAVAGFPLGWVINKFGWYQYFVIIAACSIVATLILLPLWPVNTNPSRMAKAAK
ncbi:MAG: MFS transporter family glucose-6-phosphate receptor UhpC [Parachlamydiales bacterium]|nr:MFS transporter family glucose-6-phosphate receptor UhpC [Parachlamydiales bacterium]